MYLITRNTGISARPSSPSPGDMDLHISFVHRELRADYRVCATAASNLARDWVRRRWSDSITIGFDTELTDRLERIPCEQLFLYP